MAIVRLPTPEERTAAALENIAIALAAIERHLGAEQQSNAIQFRFHGHPEIMEELEALHELVTPSVR